VWYTIADKYKIKERLWEYAKRFSTPADFGSDFVIYGEKHDVGDSH